MTIGEKIRYRRKSIGITQLRLAELSGIHPVSIRKYETDKMIPGPEQISRIADALAISYNALASSDDHLFRLETEGDVTGLLITLCKEGIIDLTGERDENNHITNESLRIVIEEKLAKLFRIEYSDEDVVKEKESSQVSLKVTSVFIQEALIKWEHNRYLYNKALSKFGDDDDKDMQKLLADFKIKVEQAELSFQNTPVLLGGGVGVPPMYLLAKRLLEQGKQVKVILGFNTAAEVFYEKQFRDLGAQVTVTTVDGSYGMKGFVTDALKQMDYTYFYTCGPEPMLKAVYSTSTTSGQLSFEKRMGCGFGACMGCSCKTITGYKRICKEGPVMRKEEILWEN